MILSSRGMVYAHSGNVWWEWGREARYALGWRRRARLQQEKGVQGCFSALDCANMSCSLWRGCELYPTHGVGQEALRVLGSVYGALGCRGGMYEECGDPCV